MMHLPGLGLCWSGLPQRVQESVLAPVVLVRVWGLEELALVMIWVEALVPVPVVLAGALAMAPVALAEALVKAPFVLVEASVVAPVGLVEGSEPEEQGLLPVVKWGLAAAVWVLVLEILSALSLGLVVVQLVC